MKQNNLKEVFIISLKLLIICSFVALLVASVNFITKDKIAYNELLKTVEAIANIYSDDVNNTPFIINNDEFIITDSTSKVIATCNLAVCEYQKDVNALYVLSDDKNNSIGYCVSIQPVGFKDAIKMLVAINSDLTVKGVEIISMSETKGIGTKAKDKSFLSKFNGRDFDSVANIDTISGATKTTEPIITAVGDSINQVVSYINSKEVPTDD